MLRALLRRVPRFGFVTLFALMLLFVSAAGWLKFHLDLWQEEEALFADLSKAGVDYAYSRHSGNIVQTSALFGPLPQPTIWDRLAPFVSRIDTLSFRGPAPPELLDRAARLPYARWVNGGGYGGGTTSVATIVAQAGFDVGPAAMPGIIPAEVRWMPTGKLIDGAEADVLRKAFAASFDVKRPAPTRGTAYVTFLSPASVDRFVAQNDKVLFNACDGVAELATERSNGLYLFDGSGARQHSRADDPKLAKGAFSPVDQPLLVVEPRQHLDYALETLEIASQFREKLSELSTIDVERIDEQRLRFDLPPIAVSYRGADCQDVYSISLVARPDLDWELEAWDVVGARTKGPATPAILPPIQNASFRGTLRREQDWIVAEEWDGNLLYFQSRSINGQPPQAMAVRHAGVAKYDLSPDLDLSHVTPEAFDAKLLPPQRELPWLPRHRATFALSLGLLAFVGMRRFWNRSNTASGGRPSSEVPRAAFDSPSGD